MSRTVLLSPSPSLHWLANNPNLYFSEILFRLRRRLLKLTALLYPEPIDRHVVKTSGKAEN